MARNMIEANKSAFQTIQHSLKERHDEEIGDGIRYISTNSEDKLWLKLAYFEDYGRFGPSIGAFKLFHQDETYLGFYGFKIDDKGLDNQLLSRVPINAGILTIILSESHIQVANNIDPANAVELLTVAHKDPAYKGYDFEDIHSIIEPIDLFSIPSQSRLNSLDIYRILIYVVCNDKSRISLPFTKRTISKFEKLAIEGAECISYENIYYALSSVNFRHCFLEIYRNIERLYPVCYISDFHDDLKIELSFLLFSSKLEKFTSWKPREESAIEKLFSLNPQDISEAFQELLKSLKLESTKDHQFLYKLRNSIVHFRLSQESFVINELIWDELIFLLLEMNRYHYSKFNNKLSSVTTS